MELQFRTGDARADHALQKIISAFEDRFPERARFVLLGSHATGRARENSDLDLLVIFCEKPNDEERAAADQLIDALKQTTAIDIDVGVCGVDDCPTVWAVNVEGGRTVFGDEAIAPPTPTIEAYTAALIADVRGLMQALRRGQVLAAPLGPPNASLPLLGYEAKLLRGPDGIWRPSTKAPAMIAFWGASALIALRAKQFIVRKDDVIDAYRQTIGDEWMQLLVDIDTVCRREHEYVIPSDSAEFAKVRAIAERVLEFENYLLALFE